MRFFWTAVGLSAFAVHFSAGLYVWLMMYKYLCAYFSGWYALKVSVLVAFPGVFVVPFLGERMQEIEGYSMETYVMAVCAVPLSSMLGSWCYDKAKRA